MSLVENSAALQKIESSLGCSFIDRAKSVVSGTIKEIDKDNDIVYIDVGLKSEGAVSLKEFFLCGEKESLAIGQKVDVFLESVDARSHGVLLSRAKAIREIAWEKLSRAYSNGETVEGIAFSRVKGGISIDFNGIIAFLPGSQIDSRPTRDVSHIIGKLLPYKVLSIDVSRSIIVSRRAILESERSEDRKQFLDSIEEGAILTGTVKNVTNYGAFVDLGDVDGLLHVTDISWEKISHPSEVLSIGQTVEVRVIKYDKEAGRLSLSMKYLAENPWQDIESKYKKDQVVNGKVTNITTYGIFVLLESGIEGLLHVSEMSWTRDKVKGHRSVQVDDEIEVVIVEVDAKRRRIALSTRRLVDNPWEEFAKVHKVGEILDGVIRNVADFGLFVGVDGTEVDGLVHLSDLSWSGDTATDLVGYQKGDNIKVVYLGSDLKNQRIRFGVKQLQNDPLESHKDSIAKDKIVTCRVIGVRDDGIEVEIFDSIRSFIKRSNISRERIEQRSNRFVVNDRVDAKIISFNDATKKIVLSIRAIEDDEYDSVIREYGNVNSGATIGNALGEAINSAVNASENNDNDKN